MHGSAKILYPKLKEDPLLPLHIALSLGAFLHHKLIYKCTETLKQKHKSKGPLFDINKIDETCLREMLRASAKAVNKDFSRKYLAHSLQLFSSIEPHWLTEAVFKIGLGAGQRWLKVLRGEIETKEKLNVIHS